MARTQKQEHLDDAAQWLERLRMQTRQREELKTRVSPRTLKEMDQTIERNTNYVIHSLKQSLRYK